MTYRLPAIALTALLVLVACVTESPQAPPIQRQTGAPPTSQLVYTPTPQIPGQDSLTVTAESSRIVQPTPTGSNVGLHCIGADGIDKIRAEYAANHLRAKQTYIGERICLRGTIFGYNNNKGNTFVTADVGTEATFHLTHSSQGPNQSNKAYENSQEFWRKWVLSSNVGDPIEAECEIEALGPTGQYTQRTPGVPVFNDCKYVVGGALWAAPTLTPLPTPPCGKAKYGAPDHHWMLIDCAAGTVTVGQAVYESRFFFGDGNATTVSYYISWVDNEVKGQPYGHPAPWRRLIEEGQGEAIATESWEAPPELTDTLISGWQSGKIKEVGFAFGGGDDMQFRLLEE